MGHFLIIPRHFEMAVSSQEMTISSMLFSHSGQCTLTASKQTPTLRSLRVSPESIDVCVCRHLTLQAAAAETHAHERPVTLTVVEPPQLEFGAVRPVDPYNLLANSLAQQQQLQHHYQRQSVVYGGPALPGQVQQAPHAVTSPLLACHIQVPSYSIAPASRPQQQQQQPFTWSSQSQPPLSPLDLYHQRCGLSHLSMRLLMC
jgi:hypothetical protein